MRTSLSLAIAISLASAIATIGCGKQAESAAPAPKSAQTAASSNTTTAALPIYKNKNGQIICPVTGEVIKSVDDAAGYQDYKGMRYYFCCGMCPPKFKKDPDKYAVRHEVDHM